MPDNTCHIFISYANADVQVAESICKFLEDRNLPCWIAPRNISAGQGYGASIIEGIRSCSIMIVVFSAHTNDSVFVQNEVERAFSLKLHLIPFRVSNVAPENSLEYFLSANQWVNAFPGKPENYFDRLHKNCCEILQKVPDFPGDGNDNGKGKQKTFIAVAVFVILVIITAVIYFYPKPRANDVKGIYPITSLRLLTIDDIRGKSRFELRLMRNEIFARHGYIFRSPDLKDHFNSQKWYKPDSSVDTTTFSFIEKTNINFIKSFEK